MKPLAQMTKDELYALFEDEIEELCRINNVECSFDRFDVAQNFPGLHWTKVRLDNLRVKLQQQEGKK